LLGQIDESLLKIVVEFKDLSTVYRARVVISIGGIRIVCVLREVARAIVGGNLTSIKLVLKVELDGKAAKGDGSSSCDMRVDACYAGNKEICLG